MSIKIMGGAKENGIVVDNANDKYGYDYPIVKWMVKGFESALSDLVTKASPNAIHEMGCGEGYWVLRWNEQGMAARGCDFSTQVIEIARENMVGYGLSPSLFELRSIYDLTADRDSADLVVCCEVLEHLENHDAGLQAFQRVVGRHLIVSVPKKPYWCALIPARVNYTGHWSNTPGHIRYCSKAGFIRFVSKCFEVRGEEPAALDHAALPGKTLGWRACILP